MKLNFPVGAADRLQRDIFVIGLNDTQKRIESDVISRETFATLTFAQVIAKTRYFEDGLKTESTKEILTVFAILCTLLSWKSYLLLRYLHHKPPLLLQSNYSHQRSSQAYLFCHGSSYEVIIQIITFQQYYPSLLNLADSTRMGILKKCDADKIKKIEASQVDNMPVQLPLCELTLEYI